MRSITQPELLRFVRARQRNVYGHDWSVQASDGQGPVLEGAWALLRQHHDFREAWRLPHTADARPLDEVELEPPGEGTESEVARRMFWGVTGDGVPELRLQVVHQRHLAALSAAGVSLHGRGQSPHTSSRARATASLPYAAPLKTPRCTAPDRSGICLRTRFRHSSGGWCCCSSAGGPRGSESPGRPHSRSTSPPRRAPAQGSAPSRAASWCAHPHACGAARRGAARRGAAHR